MIELKDLIRLETEMDKVVAVLTELEKTDDKLDKIFIDNLGYQINEMYGALKAYSVGIRQEV